MVVLPPSQTPTCARKVGYVTDATLGHTGTSIYGGTFNDIAGDQILINYHSDRDGASEIYSWLSQTDHARLQEVYFEKRRDMTGDWFLKHPTFERWVWSKEGRILWCPGIPGVGKTILASIAVNYLHAKTSNEDVFVACVYFSYKDKKQSITDVLRVLARQAWTSLPDSRPILERLYDTCLRFGSQPTLTQLTEALRRCFQALRSLYIVLDALDEYLHHQPNIDASMTILIAALKGLGGNIKLMITSRRVGNMDEIISQDGSLLVEIEAMDQDIQSYIWSRAQDEIAFPPTVDLLVKLVITVAEAAHGRFLMAELHMNAITRYLTPGEVEDALDRLTDNLDLAYELTVRRIEDQDETRKELAFKIISWLSYSLRPLALEELRHALAAAPGRTELQKYLHTASTITSVCAGLVQVDTKSNDVSFVHFTAYEFFSNRGQEILPHADEIIARSCIDYLSIPQLNLPDIMGNLRAFHENSNQLAIVNGYHFFDYAARNWGHHARSSETSVFDAIHHFLNQHDVGSVAFSYLMLCTLYESDTAPGNLAGLLSAVFFDLPHSVTRLLAGGTKINATTKQGRTPLMFAIEMNQISVIKLLVKDKQLDLNVRDAQGRTALSIAASENQEITTTLLLSRKKRCRRVNTMHGSELLTPRSLEGRPVRTLLVADQEDNKNRTALSYASANGNRSAVGRLLRLDEVRVNLKDAHGRTPLSYAAEKGHHKVVKCLLKHMTNEPDIPDNKGRTPLTYAVTNNHDSVVKSILLWRHVHVDIKDELGRTPLSYAASESDEEIVKCLLAIDTIRADSRDYNGRVPLSYAAMKGRKEAVLALLENSRAKLRIDFPDRHGRTPLAHAVMEGHLSVVKVLLGQSHIKPDLRDVVGRTPLSYAAQLGHHPIVKKLLDHPHIDVNSVDKDGRTALSYAAEHGHTEVVRMLLRMKGIKIDLKDRDGISAKGYASHRRHKSIKRLLRKRWKSGNKDVEASENDRPCFQWLEPLVQGGPSTLPR